MGECKARASAVPREGQGSLMGEFKPSYLFKLTEEFALHSLSPCAYFPSYCRNSVLLADFFFGDREANTASTNKNINAGKELKDYTLLS